MKPIKLRNSYHSEWYRKQYRRVGTVLLDFGTWEITLREVLFSFLIMGIMAVIGFIVYSAMMKNSEDEILRYRQAVHIENDDEFQHGLRTDIGDAFVNGEFSAVDPVRYNNLEGEYLQIKADYEHYTMHSYTVVHSNGKTSWTSTHFYWSWDHRKTDVVHSSKVKYCGMEFPYEKFVYGDCRTKEIIYRIDGDDRIVFHTLGTSFNATAFTTLKDNTVSDNTELETEHTIKSLYDYETTIIAPYVVLAILIVITIIFVIVFYYMDNDWLEDDDT